MVAVTLTILNAASPVPIRYLFRVPPWGYLYKILKIIIIELVGVRGFEPPAPASRKQCSPKVGGDVTRIKRSDRPRPETSAPAVWCDIPRRTSALATTPGQQAVNTNASSVISSIDNARPLLDAREGTHIVHWSASRSKRHIANLTYAGFVSRNECPSDDTTIPIPPVIGHLLVVTAPVTYWLV